MSNLESSLSALMNMTGAICAAVVDSNSGMIIGSKGNGIDMDVAAAGDTEVIRAKLRTMKDLGLQGGIEDIIVTLDSQYQILRPIQCSRDLFLYVVFDRDGSNLALTRRKVQEVDRELVI
ncbi:roadblock/LC7 domain-containing protein [Acidocella sp. KAb 2-4]|uniref:roadblock/LC7 domain-containing protein n=1 Tax=Acidocella sp. KAb 2-4 TaxID=2885158 RepID=UPI001D095F66|nr:roadblock/LC7 domain-containing protein [Acidocella sp. KAb 2-4]MCB5943467.1 roadblock/LC7 domain-containing protein [Acidocella sp. KAb 2-4]